MTAARYRKVLPLLPPSSSVVSRLRRGLGVGRWVVHVMRCDVIDDRVGFVCRFPELVSDKMPRDIRTWVLHSWMKRGDEGSAVGSISY